ncbi:MAG TPA: DinB family protein [Candidatus Acidoferrales bacterium]|nr:DinB family protein [Candidatus Acidoferrales bacterium]
MKQTKRKARSSEALASKNAKPAASGANDQALREHLKKLLDGGGAHLSWKEALSGMPAELQGVKPQGSPHTAWQLLEHVRIALWDILEFSRNPKHVSPQFPEGYWPPAETPPSAEAWDKSVKAFGRDLDGMKKLVGNPKTNLFERLAHGEGQTILREALVAADHNAYHLGQIMLLRKMLGAWPE